MSFRVFIDETDLSTLGLYVEQIPEWLNSPSRSFDALSIPGRLGSVLVRDPDYQSATLTLQGSVDPPLRTVVQRRDFEDKLKSVAFRGLVQVAIDDGEIMRRTYAVCERVTIAPVAHWSVTQVSRATVTMKRPDPVWLAMTGAVLNFQEPTAIPLGNAPSSGILRVTAPGMPFVDSVDDLVITYYHANGATLASLSFTGLTLDALFDYLEIDLATGRVVKYESGVASDVSGIMDGDLFALDPTDGDPSVGFFPLIGITAASGTPRGTLLYTQSFL